jgi:hypothetical protein
VRGLLGLFAAALASSCLGACRGSVGAPVTASSRELSSAQELEAASAPVPPPHPSVTGCVESRELLEYVLALDAHRRQARRAALAALGASDEERQGSFGEGAGPARLGASFEANGLRFAVAAELALQFDPVVTLARQGTRLRRIDERPRAHGVAVLVCGVQRCPRKVRSGRSLVRPLVIELLPGETWGEPLELRYDYWWANVSYDRSEPCASPSAASATP